ncbi:MAG TPA: DUF1428 family protein [Candidatus Nitrosocosmicus sp.]
MYNANSNENNSEIQNKNQNLILVFVYKIPRENHDQMINLNNRVIDTFKKYGVLRFEVFQLGNTDNMMDFINIAKTIEAKEDEEVWMEIQTYRDQDHLKEVGIKMMKDESMKEESQQFLKLITPGSHCNFGEFNRLNNTGFT